MLPQQAAFSHFPDRENQRKGACGIPHALLAITTLLFKTDAGGYRFSDFIITYFKEDNKKCQ